MGFEATMLGEAAEVVQERISDDELILIKGTKARTASSIILRGPNDFYCDEMERSVHDALCVVKRVLESKSVVIGGGCVEAALSIYLENFATSHFNHRRIQTCYEGICQVYQGTSHFQGCQRLGGQAEGVPQLLTDEAGTRSPEELWVGPLR